MSWCEANGVDYVFGLARNERLQRRIKGRMKLARRRFAKTGKAARVFGDFRYRTRTSWPRRRRVVAKAEYLAKGENPRFVVTSLTAEQAPAQQLYETIYCTRGEMENRSWAGGFPLRFGGRPASRWPSPARVQAAWPSVPNISSMRRSSGLWRNEMRDSMNWSIGKRRFWLNSRIASFWLARSCERVETRR